jgi:alginate lyase
MNDRMKHMVRMAAGLSPILCVSAVIRSTPPPAPAVAVPAAAQQRHAAVIRSTPPPTPAPAAAQQRQPRVFALNASALAETRARLRAGDATLQLALAALLADARKAMAAKPISVTQKSSLLPPTNDKHDYFSLSPYWWPDPSKPDGLPYIRRDGETNPESKRDLDQPRVAAMGFNVHTLGLAYYFTGKEEYAKAAAEQLRVWFLNPATRMNPHLRFAQLVRGNPNERGSGIIDTRWFIEAVDAAGLIAGSPSWPERDDRALQEWFRQYLNWLRTSPNGAHELVAKNNHGSWFAAQTGSYAFFVGDTAYVREIVQNARTRIGAQFKANGEQPEELARTRSLHYSSFNIEALSRVAEMGSKLGVNLWSYQAPEGGSMVRGLERLTPVIEGSVKAWTGPQLDDFDPAELMIHYRRFARALGERKYLQVINTLPANERRADRSALLYPDPR